MCEENEILISSLIREFSFKRKTIGLYHKLQNLFSGVLNAADSMSITLIIDK